ncbi:cyclin-P4-1-like [Dioscorea cayenensis subsp. rotundata]|uniref:Cyclin n=1 Tax=Dioscorea cayennensis subsp. rotundata TaxID=55577 RepID=A0AB40CNF2_DIOCR|nr:cyclin-P4-1-like [Dioscorea cayenensis subsp. rotundata]
MAELVGDGAGMPRVVTILSSLLQRATDRNDAERLVSGGATWRVSAFHGLTKPSISLRAYLERIFKYAGCSTSCYVVAYIYLDRFAQRHPSIPFDSLNVHRFLITSVLLAVKFLDDLYYNNAYFAKVGGISLMEMNFLEVDLLFGLGFNLNVTPFTFTTYCSILQREMYLESPPVLPKFHCFLSEEESSSCQQKQLIV